MPSARKKSTIDQRQLGPHSRLFSRGSSALDGRSREGRYVAAIRAELTAHLGGSPSTTQRMVIDRLAIVALRLTAFDAKLTEGSLTDHDARVYGALHNSFRLMVRELGLRPMPAPALTLEQIIASHQEDAA